MHVISYVYFDAPGERDKLNHLLETCTSEIQLRKEIAREFNLDNVVAGQVFSRFKDKFYQNLNKN